MNLDHEHLTRWPEYRALASAVQVLAQRLDSAEAAGADVPSRSEFVDLVRELAEVGDLYLSCTSCRTPDGWVDQLVPPYRVEPVASGGGRATYLCLRCGRDYSCYFARAGER